MYKRFLFFFILSLPFYSYLFFPLLYTFVSLFFSFPSLQVNPRETVGSKRGRGRAKIERLTDVGRNLLIFSMKTKIEKMFKIILKQHRLIRSLPIRGQWKYKRKALIVKPRLYVFFFTRTRFASSFISFLTRIGFVLFLFLLE
jgi:hypothetical protein